MIKNGDLNNYVVSLLQFSMEDHKAFAPYANTESDGKVLAGDQIIVGHELLKKTAAAFLPGIDPETEDNIDFQEILSMRLNDRMNKEPNYSKAILFTGEWGSGKHTVHNAFISEILSKAEEMLSDSSIKDYLKYYRLDASKEKMYTKAERINFISNLFASLDEIANSEWAEEYLLLVSLGDITEIMHHKSSARYFSYTLGSFLEKSRVTFYIFALYEGSASEIEGMYKAPFFVYEVNEPNIDERKQYISAFLKKYVNIIYECDASELSAMTEGFTFGMLEEFKCNCLRFVKATIKELGLNYRDYIINEKLAGGQMITLSKTVLQNIIDSIMCKKHVKRSVIHSFAENMNAAQNNSTYSETLSENKLGASNKNKNINNENEENAKTKVKTPVKDVDKQLTKEEAKAIVDELTSFTQMKEMFSGFSPCF